MNLKPFFSSMVLLIILVWILAANGYVTADTWRWGVRVEATDKVYAIGPAIIEFMRTHPR